MSEAVFAVPGSLDTATGGFRYAKRVIADLREVGWHIDVLDLGDGFPDVDEARADTACRSIAVAARRSPIIVDGLALGVLPDLAEYLEDDARLIALIHHPLALESGLSAASAKRLRLSERQALRAARLVVTTSNTTARTLVAEYRIDPAILHVAPPGTIPVPFVAPTDRSPVHLLSVGTLTRRKAYDVLLRALGRLAELDWVLTIVGDPERDPACAAELVALARTLKFDDRIAFAGVFDEAGLDALYCGCDVFVHPSRHEGYGMAPAEALARGLPIIATTAGALPEVLADTSAILVRPEDVAALAEGLRVLIESPARRAELASAARLAASRLPRWEETAQLFSSVLASLR